MNSVWVLESSSQRILNQRMSAGLRGEVIFTRVGVKAHGTQAMSIKAWSRLIRLLGERGWDVTYISWLSWNIGLLEILRGNEDRFANWLIELRKGHVPLPRGVRVWHEGRWCKKGRCGKEVYLMSFDMLLEYARVWAEFKVRRGWKRFSKRALIEIEEMVLQGLYMHGYEIGDRFDVELWWRWDWGDWGGLGEYKRVWKGEGVLSY